MRRASNPWVLLLFLILTGQVAQADSMVLLGETTGQPDVVATPDGYAIAYRSPFVEFAEVDLGGGLLHGPTELLFFTYYVPRLRTAPGGYMAFVSQGPIGPILTQRLDHEGRLVGGANRIVGGSDLFSPDVVTNSSAGWVLVYPQWPGLTTVWSQPIGPQGDALGDRRPLHLGVLEFPETFETSAAANQRGLHAAWRVEPGGAYYREMSPDGRPRGPLIQLDSQLSFGGVALAASGRREFAFYGTGPTLGESDVVLRIRRDGGAFSEPMVISDLPGREAQGLHPIDAVAQSDRVAVIWRHSVDLPFPLDRDWYFQELDADGNPLAPRRNLDVEFDRNIFSAGLHWDELREQYVVGAFTDQGTLLILDPVPD